LRFCGKIDLMTEETLPLAVVTGAARRLGRVFALSLARQGYAILLHYNRSITQAVQTADEISSLGVPVYNARADLTQREQIRNMFTIVDSTPHKLRVLVNSAAVMARGDVRNLPVDDFDAALALNLRAPFLCAQEAVKRMDDGGLIVNITDVGASKAWTGYPAYIISKAGLESLTRILARAFAPSVRVNAIAPGLTLRADDFPPDQWQRLVERVPFKRPASGDELTSALEFLLKNEYITGETITVDGGYSLV
jgi:NAD(P)-dependent dehydrogenase (short-subunit alcohol dehydrogenase family)